MSSGDTLLKMMGCLGGWGLFAGPGTTDEDPDPEENSN